MILAAAVVLGLMASLAFHGRRAFTVIASIPLRSVWLVLLAIALQLPLLRAAGGPPDLVRAQQALFLISYLFLLAFVWRNWRLGAIVLIGLGIAGNLTAVVANGGLMPITPQTVARINPGSTMLHWPEGIHYGHSKDIILSQERTHLWVLADILVVPAPFPWPTAFSVGDLLIAVGVVALLVVPQSIVKRRTNCGA
jgi:hypothetical protein